MTYYPHFFILKTRYNGSWEVLWGLADYFDAFSFREIRNSKHDLAHASGSSVFFWCFTTFALFIFVLTFALFTIFRDAYWRRSAIQFGECKSCAFAIKLNVPNVIQCIHHMVIYYPDLSQVALYLSLSYFLHYCNLSWCILAATSAMQFGECKCVFAIKWKVPNVILVLD